MRRIHGSGFQQNFQLYIQAFGCFTTTARFQTCFVHHPKSSPKRQRAIGIVLASQKMSEANTSSLAISHPQSLRMIVVSSTRTMPLVDWHSIEKPWSFFSIHRTPVKNIWGEGEFGTIQDVITMYTNTHTHTHRFFGVIFFE